MKICSFNVENLFLHNALAKIPSASQYEKSAEKLEALAKTMQMINADIFMLSEIGGIYSLELFNTKYLNNEYVPSLIPGNSERGIELAYLIKKKFKFFWQHKTHKDRNINFDPSIKYTFSRDVAELRLYPTSPDLPNSRPIMILLLVHLKSQLDSTGPAINQIDRGGKLRRTAEAQTLMEIYKELVDEFNNPSRSSNLPEVPICMAGDFNGNAQRKTCDSEFATIYKENSLADLLELIQIPIEQRISLTYFVDATKFLNQFDYFFVPLSLRSEIVRSESGVAAQIDVNGLRVENISVSSEEIKRKLPSDHFPIVLTLRNF